MPRIDLFDRVRGNEQNIGTAYATVSSRPGVAKFAEEVQLKARISINRHAQPLLELLVESRFLSGFRDAQRRGEEFEHYLNTRWVNTPKKFIRRRVMFSSTFEHGEDLLFGALNGGNAGAAAKNGAYGYYCIVLKPIPFDRLKELAYCKRDSLAEDTYWECDAKVAGRKKCHIRCADGECRVALERLVRDYATHSHRGRLAAMKHSNDPRLENEGSDHIADILIESRPAGKGADGTEEYIEACFVLPVGQADVEEVRLHSGMAVALVDEATMEVAGGEGRASFFKQLSEVLNQLSLLGIPWVME